MVEESGSVSATCVSCCHLHMFYSHKQYFFFFDKYYYLSIRTAFGTCKQKHDASLTYSTAIVCVSTLGLQKSSFFGGARQCVWCVSVLRTDNKNTKIKKTTSSKLPLLEKWHYGFRMKFKSDFWPFGHMLTHVGLTMINCSYSYYSRYTFH